MVDISLNGFNISFSISFNISRCTDHMVESSLFMRGVCTFLHAFPLMSADLYANPKSDLSAVPVLQRS